MEKISDFFDEIKSRVTNPLFVSFIISWLIINWKIPIGFFSGIEVLKTDGYKSYIDLIEKNTTTYNFFCKPLFYALLYTFGFPFARTGILAFSTWIKTISTNWNLRISKDGKMPVSRYIRLRKIYSERQKLVEEILTNEGQFVEENEQLKSDKLQLGNEKISIFNELNDFKRAVNNIDIIRGNWRFHSGNENSESGDRISISGNQITILGDGVANIQFRISDFHHNPNSKTIVFYKISTKNDLQWSCHSLSYSNPDANNITELRGFENTVTKIFYEKMN